MIGPKCQLCGKQRYFHSQKNLLCPVGKRQTDFRGEKFYSEFHAVDRFTPREPSKGGASEKRKDRGTRRSVKALPCVVCGAGDCDPCHIRGWKVSQCDAAFNLLPMCREHHAMQHNCGWKRMADAFPGLAEALSDRGWEFFLNPNTGEWALFNEKEVEMNRKRRAV